MTSTAPGPPRVLLVEDEASIAEAIALNLREEGYEVSVARRGDEGLHLCQNGSYELLILDVMLPGVSGQEICRAVRRRSPVPILMISARSREMDKVVGLEIGADDYLTKPFGMPELIARVKALLRRSTPASAPEEEVYMAGAVTLNVARRRVTRDGEVVSLRPKQFELLRVLIANRGRVIPRDRLLELVWGEDEYLDSGTLDVHIRWLRQKLEQDPSKPTRILTVRGVGYVYDEDAP